MPVTAQLAEVEAEAQFVEQDQLEPRQPSAEFQRRALLVEDADGEASSRSCGSRSGSSRRCSQTSWLA